MLYRVLMPKRSRELPIYFVVDAQQGTHMHIRTLRTSATPTAVEAWVSEGELQELLTTGMAEPMDALPCTCGGRMTVDQDTVTGRTHLRCRRCASVIRL